MTWHLHLTPGAHSHLQRDPADTSVAAVLFDHRGRRTCHDWPDVDEAVIWARERALEAAADLRIVGTLGPEV